MSKHRIYLPDGPDQSLPVDRLHYLTRVLRLRPGDRLCVFDGTGAEWLAELEGGGASSLRVVQQLDSEPQPTVLIRLVQAVAKGDRMDTTIQKSTELGVAEIQPVLTQRTEVKLKGERLQRRQQHWSGVMISACEQSGRRRLPLLHPLQALDSWLSELDPVGAAYLLNPEQGQRLRELDRPDGAITLAVGPEGGFTEQEITMLNNSGFANLSLGPRVLRTETAGPAAIAAIQALWGDG